MKTYLDQLEDIPGTTVFTAQRARQGYQLSMFCMSLLKPANREAFKADERAYLAKWKLTKEQREAILARDYGTLIAQGGGNIYFLCKIGATDGLSTQSLVGSMSGMTGDEYAAMMSAGGRSPEGQRSKAENAANERLAA